MLRHNIFIHFLLAAGAMGFPPLWDEVPRSVEDFERINGRMVINPWEYRQRLGMYRMLIEETKGAFAQFGPENKMNVLWGLPLQHGWQFKTKRLSDIWNDSSDATYESPNSWWAAMNYYLSVIPFLGAVEAGYFSDLRYPLKFMKSTSSPFQLYYDEVEDPVYGKSARFCHTFVQCQYTAPKSTAAWTVFFKTLLSLEKSHKAGQGKDSDTLDQILALMWTAHTHSLDEGRAIFTREMSLMTEEEARFGDIWVSMVHFVAAVRFETNYDNVKRYQDTFLPKRVLKEGDAAPFISDFTDLENRALYMVESLIWADNVTGGSVYAVWKRVMCSSAGRAEGRHLLNVGLTTLSAFPGSLLRMTWIWATQKCDT